MLVNRINLRGLRLGISLTNNKFARKKKGKEDDDDY